MKNVLVKLWGKEVGVISMPSSNIPIFEYMPKFVETGLPVAPIKMPLKEKTIYSFPEHSNQTGFNPTFHGLPGLLADSLPEKFGNRLLNITLAKQGRSIDQLSPLERLSAMGSRGMGALEFEPNFDQDSDQNIAIDIQELVVTAKSVMSNHQSHFIKQQKVTLEKLISVGISAGGAKAKAVIAINEATNDMISGQADVPEGYQHWLLKFDSIENEEHAIANEMGRIEYAYYLMAIDAGIEMTECRLLERGDLAHFMTRRFDRIRHEKVHIQSYCAIAHADRNPLGHNSYESLFKTARQLGCKQQELNQLYRRMVFNILARNQDDHSKNFAFAMDFNGEWFLAPAFDICFSYKRGNPFIEHHQLSCNAKRNNFVREDLIAAASLGDVKQPEKMIDEIGQIVANWLKYADQVGLSEPTASTIDQVLRRI